MKTRPPAMHALLNAPALKGYPKAPLKALATSLFKAHQKTPFAYASLDAWVELVRERYTALMSAPLKPLYNATGVLLSTNLGRACLEPSHLKELELLSGYINLEVDHRGKRADRCALVQELLKMLFSAEDALVLNNNASALVLVASVFAPKAQGCETLLSYGQLVEIGGHFRAHELLECVTNLKFVGSTNKTYLQDYQHALSPNTTLITTIHLSNFVQQGFVASVGTKELYKLATERGVLFYEDLGSLQSIMQVQTALKHAHLLSFSTDKLFGSVQGGVVLGAKEAICQLAKHPLYRAFRADKIQLYMLARSLQEHISGQANPTQRFLEQDKDTLLNKALKLLQLLKGVQATLIETTALVGGGVADSGMKSFGLLLSPPSDFQELHHALYQQGLACVLRHDGVLLDTFALFDKDLHAIAKILNSTINRHQPHP
ncbi:L-seryl-tRNA(Sec) selenium transferase [Helicobacter heilmannii]|uniref:L-seryl-tRNA(Sec) selenium transferase n=1 Tax=Helicobacter heilmannii TaxID=35817 RepID=A0A0K2YB82_HELHE|nr:L-seryl-tRNA(Sec) selenium transferase [Helicobacter heilmannii]CCM12141.1 L-seryl-tRNA(Sec) selenium transferase [Helicobacter heilmannii ASB1.4]CRI34230.1 L-seryl-tRNA(Sec) selenium transferase [Helicobacter heilmannii]